MAKESINITCKKCGHLLKVTNPGHSGVFQVECPKCQHHIQLQLKAKPLLMDASSSAEGKTRVPLLTDITPVKDGTAFAVKPAVKANETYAFKCPTCGKPVLFKLPKEGVQGVKCRKCNTQFFVKGIGNKTTPPKKEASDKKNTPTAATQRHRKMMLSPGMLTWGNIFHRKNYMLNEGSYVLGRKDESVHSDLEFKDDTMSRRSVIIDVTRNEKGYFFKLTVKRASNPVFHNNRPLAENEIVYLNYGDAIQLGRTVINFKQSDGKK